VSPPFEIGTQTAIQGKTDRQKRESKPKEMGIVRARVS